MTPVLNQSAWPVKSLGDALLTLASYSGLPYQSARLALPAHLDEAACSSVDAIGGGRDKVQREPAYSAWLQAAADHIGLEAEPVAAPYAQIESMLQRASPALIAIPFSSRDESDAGTKLLVVIGASRRALKVVAPDLSIHRVPISEVRQSMCRAMTAPHHAPVEALLGEIGLVDRQRDRARDALLATRLADKDVGGCWLLRAPGFGEIHWSRRLGVFIGSHVIAHCCVVMGWSLLGWMTFSGQFDWGVLQAWMLLMGCAVPFRLLSTAVAGRLSLEFSSSLRRRLLAGALRLDPDHVRVEGTGALLGRTLEVDTLEQVALAGGAQGVLSIFELIMAACVLGFAAGNWGVVVALALFVVLAVWLALRKLRRLEAWSDARLSLTNELVERMIGHRTTLAQERSERMAAITDQSLDRYVAPSASLDRESVRLQAIIPRAWLLFGLAWLGPEFINGGVSVTTLAISLGGLILARQGLQRLVEGLDRLAVGVNSWQRLQPFLAKQIQPEPIGDPDFCWSAEIHSRSTAVKANDRMTGLHPASNQIPAGDLLSAYDVVFRHAGRSEPLLRDLGLRIRAGDRLLLEGPSGGGKSTLATLLSGGRTGQSGVLLLSGLDRQTLGRAWRQRVVQAPQFHQNHVLTGTFLFNLLMGRAWPPSKESVADAERLCGALDLGPLIDRMPGGLMQMVGETGWQLSHGERSRLFLARVLLQRAEVILLDETFAALDPETLSRTLPCVLEQAPTLLVIAHP